MSTIRIVKDKNFTVMTNRHLRDAKLSLKARGLMSTMLSLPDNWDYSVKGLEKICRDGRDSISSAISELESAGYLHRTQGHSSDGTFCGYDYIIYESPFTENPLTGKPFTENPQQINTKQVNTKSPPISPQGERVKKKRAPRSAPDHDPDMFARFWKAYPRGEDKQGAMNAWDELKPDRKTMLTMGKALNIMKRSEEWQRGIGIPYAVRWLKRREWENEKLFAISEPEAPPPEVDAWD